MGVTSLQPVRAFGTAPKYLMARVLKLGILLGCDGYGCDSHAPIYTRHHLLLYELMNYIIN